MSREEIALVWRRGQRGWPESYPLVQAPNPPLLIALLGWVLVTTDFAGAAGVGRWLAALGLIVWAGAEVIAGANLFRRGLGAAVLIWLVLGLFGVH